MKGIIILVVVFLLTVLVAIPVFAATIVAPIKWNDKDWKQEDTAIQTAVTIFMAADWLQTRDISSNPDRFSETNNVLGPHPSLEEVDRYFATCLIGNAVIAYVLPRDIRRWWQTVSLNMEMEFVNHNYNLGIKMKF
jgi:hypothetical protein